MMDRNRIYRAGIWAISAPLPQQLRVSVRHRLRARLDNRRALAADWLVLSRAKSGRTWLRAILSRLYQQHYQLPERELLEYDNFHRLNHEIPVVAMTHGHYLDTFAQHRKYGASVRSKPTVLLMRDPRDVAVSEYFQSTRRASEYKRELYKVDQAQSMFDFVMQSPVGLPAACAYLNHWHEALQSWERVICLRYEDLRAEPETQILRLTQFVSAPFSEAQIHEAVAYTDFEALKKKERENFYDNSRLRARNPDDPDSFKVRRGKVGGYRDYFDAEQQAKMDRFVEENLNPVLGYSGGAATAHA